MDYGRYKRISNTLKARRIALGLSQNQVALVLGLKDNTLISRWERGETLPSLVNALRLSSLYHAPIEELFMGISHDVVSVPIER